jgi:DNA-binding PadR family transcriptional regulator
MPHRRGPGSIAPRALWLHPAQGAGESTLYPLLRRLETQGLLQSEWREEDKRNKRFYRLSGEGEAILALLLVEWNGINESLHKILKDPR